MIGRFGKHLLRLGLRDDAEPQDPGEELRLAAACLLVEAALVDGHVDDRETGQLTAALVRFFGTGPEEARALVEQATGIATDAVDWNRFTRVLKSEFDHGERVAMMEMLWEVVLADGELHAYEDSMVRRIAGLLHIDDHDRAMTRRRARERLSGA